MDSNISPAGKNQDALPALVIVGGFLGSGKTTLILKAADLLRRQGKRVAVILNDQDAGLVDTHHVLAREFAAREVADGCFCCRFSEFIGMVDQLAADKPDVIFAEPVGSCIDLNATVIRPIQTLYSDRLKLGPLSVLLDPATSSKLRSQALDDDVRYLVSHQLAEADLVCTTKEDLDPGRVELPFPIDFRLSGKTGLGVEDWLNEVITPSRIVGARLLDVDYSRYADAEAALGWLNLHAHIDLASPLAPALICGPLLDATRKRPNPSRHFHCPFEDLRSGRRSMGKGQCLCEWNATNAEGDLLADPAQRHELALNLRALADPTVCKDIVLSALGEIDGTLQIRHLRAFRPPPPTPEHRMSAVSRGRFEPTASV